VVKHPVVLITGALTGIGRAAALAFAKEGSRIVVSGRHEEVEQAGSGVRINAIAPGPTETAMLNRFTGSAERKAGLVAGVPLQRVGEPDEIANAIVFLASDKSSFTTGQVLSVDGGKSAT